MRYNFWVIFIAHGHIDIYLLFPPAHCAMAPTPGVVFLSVLTVPVCPHDTTVDLSGPFSPSPLLPSIKLDFVSGTILKTDMMRTEVLDKLPIMLIADSVYAADRRFPDVWRWITDPEDIVHPPREIVARVKAIL